MSIIRLSKNNILYEHQFGHKPGKNTTHAILSLVNHINNSLENNIISCGIFLDISNAFDTTEYSIFMGKLNKYGIRCIALNWFKLLVRTLPVCVSGYFFFFIKKLNVEFLKDSYLGVLFSNYILMTIQT